MKKVLLLGTLLGCGFATATNTGPANLKFGSLCFSSDNVQLQREGSFLPKDAQKIIFQAVDRKLTAYRIKHFACKSIYTNSLNVQIDELGTGNGAVLYSISVNIYDNFTYGAGLISIYNIGGFGRSPTSGTQFIDTITSTLSEYMDQLAADFAKANP
jgi:hypothetical protein